jgi:phosphatidylinositol alpha-mannosyltransferase
MISPYSLTRPGGVQGQVIGLSQRLRAHGHEVTVLGPVGEGETLPQGVGEHFVIGRPTALRSNGSVAPVALWPTASARVERFVRTSRWRPGRPTASCSGPPSPWSGRTTGPG